MSKTEFHIYVNQELVRVADLEELQEESPKWDGKIGLGDIVTAYGVKRRVKEIHEHEPDSEDDVYLVKLFLE
ncbi:hypothetical protein C0971_15760 [Bacillus methanolicus]|uniref:hypothetical protein n=1 Tax=Bacillus methanolicus TaxID=1471 RepID=UPI00200F0D21|nr:hypothetical protein [Bacillus methanolicus]UQD53315.1 hypothetical protein C0971_15760 [Bacillus methanolicus]